MKLYVCWTTHIGVEAIHAHACGVAHRALVEAGYEPEVVKVRGLGVGPKIFQWTTDGRREVEALSGQKAVPVLVTDDGEVITESKRIAEWAKAHPQT
jgi:hypothetical protein